MKMVFMNANPSRWQVAVGRLFCSVLLAAPAVHGAPGQLDVDFGSSNTVNSLVRAIALQSDGRILIGGAFNDVLGQSRTGIVRMTEEGLLDPTFDAGGAPEVQHIIVQPDGKILVSGSFTTFNGYQRNSILRLHPDGKVDPTFKTQFSPAPVDIRHFVLRGDGRIYITAVFGSFGGHATTNVALLNPDGSVDTSFRSSIYLGGVTRLAIAPDPTTPESLYAGGLSFIFAPGGAAGTRHYIGRMDALTGVADATFNIPITPLQVSGTVLQMHPLADGTLLAAGVHVGPGTNTLNGMLRFLPSGAVDTTFQAGPVPHPFDPQLTTPFQAFARLVDGRIVAGGRFDQVQGVSRTNLVQLLPTGAIDPSFAPNGGPDGAVSTIVAQPDGKVIIAGTFQNVGGLRRPYLARLHGNGSAPLVLEQPHPLTIWEGETAMLRLRPAGDPDPTITWYHGAAAVGTGKTLAISHAKPSDAGAYYARLENVHGVTDSATVALAVNFGSPQIIQQPVDAKVNLRDPFVNLGGVAQFRVLVEGSRPFAYQWFEDGLLLPGQTNALLEVGITSTNAYGRRYRVIVTNPRGATASDEAQLLASLEGLIDVEFGHLAQFARTASPWLPHFCLDTRAATSLAMQPDGHILVGGGVLRLPYSAISAPPAFSDTNPITSFASLGITQNSNHLVRLTAAGELDLGDLATQYLDGPVNDIAVAPDASFYVVGAFERLGSTRRSRLLKFNANGTLAHSFDVAILPTNAAVTCVAVQRDGRVVIGGTFTNVAGQPRTNIAQLQPSGAVDPTFLPALSEVLHGRVMDVATQPDAKVLASGSGAFLQGGFGPRRPQLVRFNADGSWDEDFDTYGGAGGNAENYSVKQIMVQPDGRLLIAGSFNRFGGAANTNIARLLPSGVSDPEFDPQGECCASAGAGVNAIGLAPDGRVYVTGHFLTPSNKVTRVARLQADGRFDPSWQPATRVIGGVLYFNRGAAAVLVQSNAQPIFAGDFRSMTLADTAIPQFPPFIDGTSVPVPNQPGVRFWFGNARHPLYGLMRCLDTEVPFGNLVIAAQPQGGVLASSTDGHALSVAAYVPGITADISYQWMKGGAVLPGETNNFLWLRPLNPAQSGAYSVLVTAYPPFGLGPSQNVLSQTAHIKVLPAQDLTGSLSFQPGGLRWLLPPAQSQSWTTQDLASLQLLASTDLVNWVVVPNAFSVQNGSLLVNDPDAAIHPQRFYQLQFALVSPNP